MNEDYKKQIFNIIGCNQTFKAPDVVFNCATSSTTTTGGRVSRSSSSSSSSSKSNSSSSNSCCPQYICCSSSSSSSREDFCNCGDSRFPEEPVIGDDISPRGRGNWNRIPKCCRCALGYYRVNPFNQDCGKGPFNSPCDNFSCVSRPGDWAGSFQSMCREAHPNMQWFLRQYYWCNGGRQPNTPNTADQFLCVKGICICKPLQGLCPAPNIENWWYGRNVCIRCKSTSTSSTTSSNTSSNTSSTTSSSLSSSSPYCQCPSEDGCGKCCNGCCCGPNYRPDGFGNCIPSPCGKFTSGSDQKGYDPDLDITFSYYIPYVYDNTIFKEKTKNIITDCTNTESPPCWCNDTCNITIDQQNNLYNTDTIINNIGIGESSESLIIQNTFLKDGILYESENNMFNESQDQINNT